MLEVYKKNLEKASVYLNVQGYNAQRETVTNACVWHKLGHALPGKLDALRLLLKLRLNQNILLQCSYWIQWSHLSDWIKLPEVTSSSTFSKLTTRNCDMSWTNGLIRLCFELPSFASNNITFLFTLLVLRSNVWKIEKASVHLTATLDAQSLANSRLELEMPCHGHCTGNSCLHKKLLRSVVSERDYMCVYKITKRHCPMQQTAAVGLE